MSSGKIRDNERERGKGVPPTKSKSTGGTSGTVKCDGGTQMDGASADARFAAKAKAKARAQEREEDDRYF